LPWTAAVFAKKKCKHFTLPPSTTERLRDDPLGVAHKRVNKPWHEEVVFIAGV